MKTDKQRYSNIPETLLPKIAAHAKTTEQKARGVCQRHDVPTDTADAFIADVEDMLHGRYYPMHATTEQMRLLCKNVSGKSWDKTANAALCMVTMYYREIVAMLDGVRSMGFFAPPINLFAVSVLEAQQRKDAGATIGGEEYSTEQLKEQAQRLYYSFCVQIIGENTDCTEEELRTIDAIVPIADEDKERAISMALDMRQQHARIEEYYKKRQAEKKKKDEDNLPTLYDDSKIYSMPMNMALLIGRGLQTANIQQAEAQPQRWQPLRLQIEDKAKRAEAIMSSSIATDREKKEAAQFVATRTSAMQALEFLQRLPQTLTPVSGNTSYSEYELTPRELTIQTTGSPNPNNNLIETTLRGYLFLSSQRVQIEERLQMKTKEKDADGKPIYKEKKHITNFQPLVIKFDADYENDVLIEQATKVTLRVDKTTETGRSAAYMKEGRQNYRILPQTPIYTTAEQMAAFHNSAQEITFLRLIQSSSHCDEEEILRRVFDYDSKQTLLDEQKKAARRAVEALKTNPEATAADIEQAEQQAKAAELQARYQITKHKERDVRQLTAWFERAVKLKVICSWQRKEPKMPKKKCGEGYVWEWKKAPTKAEQQAQRRQQRAALKEFVAASKASKQRIKEMRKAVKP